MTVVAVKVCEYVNERVCKYVCAHACKGIEGKQVIVKGVNKNKTQSQVGLMEMTHFVSPYLDRANIKSPEMSKNPEFPIHT